MYHWHDTKFWCPKLKDNPNNSYFIIFLIMTSYSKATNGISGSYKFKQNLKICQNLLVIIPAHHKGSYKYEYPPTPDQRSQSNNNEKSSYKPRTQKWEVVDMKPKHSFQRSQKSSSNTWKSTHMFPWLIGHFFPLIIRVMNTQLKQTGEFLILIPTRDLIYVLLHWECPE